MTTEQPTYQFKQWTTNPKHDNYMKWFVVAYGIVDIPMYLRVDGTWQNVMQTSWLPNGGTYFNTQNEASIALALSTNTGKTRGSCHQKKDKD